MKNLCASVLIISGVLINFQSYSQLYTSEIEVTNSTNGNVGIGTNTPIAPLYLLAPQSNQGFKIGATGMSTVISLHVSSGNYGYFHLGGNTTLRGNGQNSYFDGNLGIGTTSPTSTLHIYKNGNGWLQQIKGTAFNAGETVGLKFLSGYGGDNGKWAGIAAMAENLHSNDTGLGLFADQLERVRIKANGNVGIGTTNPSQLLHVSGGTGSAFLKLEADTDNSGENDNPRIEISQDGGLVQAFLGFNESVGGDVNMFRIGVYNVGNYRWSAMVIETGNGHVGINTNTPGYQLDVNGTARVTTLIQSSDERLKKDIRAFSSDDKMNNLSVYKYKLKGGIQSAVNTMLADSVTSTEPTLANQSLTKDHVGLMAQEVEAIYPDLVYTDQQGYKAIDYSQFIPILIDRTNKQEEKINSQQQEIDQLKKEMAELKILITSNK